MSDYLNPDQIRDLYAETIAAAQRVRWGYDDEVWQDMRSDLVKRAMLDVDALAAAGLLPTVTLRYAIDGQRMSAYRTPLRDVPPPPPAPGKGRGPR